MNYDAIYQRLINSARCRGLDKKVLQGYFEKHHILPKCMGGDDSYDNLVLLTGREHFIAHKLLCKLYPDNRSLFFALYQMSISHTNRGYRVTSREYQLLKSSFSLQQSGENNPAKSPEVRLKMSAAKKGKPSTFKGKKMSDYSRKKLSNSQKGKHVGERNNMYGTRPWKTGPSLKSAASQRVWACAKEAYELFIKGCGHKKIYSILEVEGSNKSSFIKMVEHFKRGWNPNYDSEWKGAFEFNPYKDIS